MVGDASPDGIEDGDGYAAPELLVDAADEIWEENADVEARQVSLSKDVSSSPLRRAMDMRGLTAAETMTLPTAVFHRVCHGVAPLP